MMRSRLRRPTSKSMTATLWPRWARPVAREADVVVLPTPPLPDVTTMISVKVELSSDPSLSCGRSAAGAATSIPAPARPGSSQIRNLQLVAVQVDLHRLAFVLRGDLLEHAVMAGDGNQFRPEFAAIDARAFVAQRAGEGASAQRTVHVHVAVGQHFRAVGDRRHDHQVAAARVDLLAGAYRLRMVLRGDVRRRGA